ncbi:cytochrome c oxidase assembly protein [Skermanella rosea]|uniref:cytochrome c oxidase assembly protein n=1 Tax=Skermanella rosea TaxID=1817965 RepID=UPI001933741D|nr:cytochrome c oxidase assembly protein [Skermanella rosea]UEM01832.1 cytochrome c oxidase assembly protein [Skermanella rosea]
MTRAQSSPAGAVRTAPGRAEAGRSGPAELWPLAAGLLLLALLWFGPLPERARGSFAAHMVMHMGVVAVAAPLLAVGIARAVPRLVSSFPPALAIVASAVEFVAVWTWHAPALHDAARMDPTFLILEQASFLAAGVLVWATAIGAPGDGRVAARAAGVCALLITSMHMVLLGGLLLFAPRPLYACAEVCSPAAALTPLGDQQLGGALMLVIGGSAYLAGGLALLSSVLRDRAPTGETA